MSAEIITVGDIGTHGAVVITPLVNRNTDSSCLWQWQERAINA